MAPTSSKQEVTLESIPRFTSCPLTVTSYSTTFSNRRRKSRRVFVKHEALKIRAILICLLATWVNPSTSFHVKPSITSRPRASSLFVVEPKERIEQARNSRSELPLSVDAGSSSDFFFVSACDENPETSGGDEVEETCEENREDFQGDKTERLERVAKADALLSRRSASRSRDATSDKTTSVGTRRVGSASHARVGARSMSRLTDAVKKAASSNVKEQKTDESAHDQLPSARISKSLIQSTVKSMIQTSASIGLFEFQPNLPMIDSFVKQCPAPGSILLQSERSTKPWKASDRISVRVATVADDLDIANLRLSVFSDFSPDMRRAFCSKSCQVLSSRRNRGATCIVATVPRYGSIMSPRPDIILGSAECSYHEFEGTSLGRRRPNESILYITEVAVSPSARRKGIGQKIMQVRVYSGQNKQVFYLDSLQSCLP